MQNVVSRGLVEVGVHTLFVENSVGGLKLLNDGDFLLYALEDFQTLVFLGVQVL